MASALGLALALASLWPSPPGRSTAAGPTDVSAGCEPASAELVSVVEQRLTVPGAGLGAGWVEPAEAADAYYLAAETVRPDVEGESGIGVWVTNQPEGKGSVFAVDGLAVSASSWEPAARTAVGFSLEDPAARRAVACAASAG